MNVILIASNLFWVILWFLQSKLTRDAQDNCQKALDQCDKCLKGWNESIDDLNRIIKLIP